MWLAIGGGNNAHTSVPPEADSFSKFYTSKAERQGPCLHLTLGSHYFFIFVPPSPRPIHDGLRV